MKKQRKGISLVVLTITIIVLIILAGVTILTISNADLINKSTETAFRSNISNYLEEYNAWLSIEKMKHRGNLEISKINASNKVAYNGNYITDIIKNIKSEDIEKYERIGGNLVYTGTGEKDNTKLENETKWAKEVGLKSVEKAKGEEDTIVFTNTTSDSRYNDLKVCGSSENGVTGLSEISLTVTQNLIDTGFGEYKDGTNFSSYVANIPSEKVKGGISCFYTEETGGFHQNCRIKDYITIDRNKKYEISMYVKPNVVGERIYSGLMEYDVDKLLVKAEQVMYIPDTLTYLTEDLKNGDTVVHLDDVSNFVNSTQTYKMGFIFWNYKDSTGHLYEPLTYSLNTWSDLYTADNVDKTNNTIILKSAWNKGTIKAGTKLSQCDSGSTFNYSLDFNIKESTDWEYRHETISGVGFGRTVFRAATKYVQWFIMPNYNYIEGGGAKVANIIFAESDKYNKIYTIDMTGHEPLRTMEDGTSDYIDFKTKKIVRNVGINNGTMYKLSSVTYENISLPDIPIYEGNTAITLNQTGRLEGTYIK